MSEPQKCEFCTDGVLSYRAPFDKRVHTTDCPYCEAALFGFTLGRSIKASEPFMAGDPPTFSVTVEIPEPT